MRISTEELTLQNGLKTFNLPGQRGLRHPQTFSCLAEVQLMRDSEKALQLFDTGKVIAD
ncbi:hypothetical protein EKTHUN627_08800 [Enterobacter kobei]|nr:hypothetical protein EKTHUN627_08800 [Enterobacter kobei]